MIHNRCSIWCPLTYKHLFMLLEVPQMYVNDEYILNFLESRTNHNRMADLENQIASPSINIPGIS